jgi:excinuclease UvrABC helicase subunit UvrB
MMLSAAKSLDFDNAARLRDEMLAMMDRLEAIS